MKPIKVEHNKMIKYNFFEVVHRDDVPKGTKVVDYAWAMKKKPSGVYRATQQTIYTVQHPKNAPYMHHTCTVQVQYMHCTSTVHTLYMHCTCTVLYSALLGLCIKIKIC